MGNIICFFLGAVIGAISVIVIAVAMASTTSIEQYPQCSNDEKTGDNYEKEN